MVLEHKIEIYCGQICSLWHWKTESRNTAREYLASQLQGECESANNQIPKLPDRLQAWYE